MTYYALHGDTPETRRVIPFDNLDDAKHWCLSRADKFSEIWDIIDEDGKSVQGFGMAED